MFALEITFSDGVSQPEMIFVRRPQAIIGAADAAHVAIEDLRSAGYQLRLVRDLGRRFRIKPIGAVADQQLLRLLEGTFEGDTGCDLSRVRLHVTALDVDLLLKDAEPPDRAGVRVLRQACSVRSPLFPALVVMGATPTALSFVPDQPLYIGRSKKCALRLDSADISGEHARIGYESGEFWVEDLGSTNGTFVRQQQISGRVSVRPGEPIVLGREVSLMGVTSADQIQRAVAEPSVSPRPPAVVEQRYPILLSLSELVRPARVALQPGVTVRIGRDPSSDVWLGAPHVSRKHCSVSVSKSGKITVQDHSTNGTAYDLGILHEGDQIEVRDEARVLDFGGGVTLAICLSAEDEATFTGGGGSAAAFTPDVASRRTETPAPAAREAEQEMVYTQTPRADLPGDRSVFSELLQLYAGSSWIARSTFLIGFFGVVFVVVLVAHVLLVRL